MFLFFSLKFSVYWNGHVVIQCPKTNMISGPDEGDVNIKRGYSGFLFPAVQINNFLHVFQLVFPIIPHNYTVW